MFYYCKVCGNCLIRDDMHHNLFQHSFKAFKCLHCPEYMLVLRLHKDLVLPNKYEYLIANNHYIRFTDQETIIYKGTPFKKRSLVIKSPNYMPDKICIMKDIIGLELGASQKWLERLNKIVLFQ